MSGFYVACFQKKKTNTKQKQVIVNEERAESYATSGPRRLCAAQRSASGLIESRSVSIKENTPKEKKKVCTYHLHKLFPVGKL